MDKIKLSNEIFKSLNGLGFNLDCQKNLDRVMRFYLEKDIVTIIGKNEFYDSFLESSLMPNADISDFIDTQKISSGKHIKFMFTYMGEAYDVSLSSGNTLTISNSSGVLAQIKMEGNSLINYLFSKDKGQGIEAVTYRTQFASADEVEIFTCVKTIKNADVLEENVGYSLKPIRAKFKTKEYFNLTKIKEVDELEKPKQSFIQRILGSRTDGSIIKIEEHSCENDIFDCLDGVFDKLEEMCDKEIILKDRK